MTGLKIWLIAATATTASFAAAPANAAPAAAPPQVAQCAGCHGANGMGNAVAGFPALAGQPAPYLDQQLYAFKHGNRRNAIMKGFATPLNAADRKAIAAYYNGLPVVAPTAAQAAATDKSGETLARYGLNPGTPHAIPACESCHGAGGQGVAPEFPRLAGQPAAYLEAQLKDWQSGSRNGNNLHLMYNVARMLNPAQIKAVSTYFAALPPR